MLFTNRLAQLVSPRKFEFVESQIDSIEEDDVLIEVISCGICSSEMPIYTGDLIGTPGVSFRYKEYPAKLGHEVVGRVVDIGSKVTRFKISDIVTGLTYSGAGFAKFFVEKESMLHSINGFEQPEYILGEPLMATVNILNNINFEFGDSVSVIGEGCMSLLLISALRHYPLDKVFIFGHHEFKLDIIRSFGFEHVVNSKKQDPWQYVMDHTDGLGVNVSIEYAGNTDALRLAASITKAKVRSKLVLASSYDNSMPFTICNYLQNRAPVIIPAYPNQSKDKFKDLSLGIWAYEKKIIEIKPLITHEFSLDSLGDAYSYITDNRDKYIKGIVRV